MDLGFPFRGLNRDRATGDQPPGTTFEAVNVRGIDPETGRSRGGVREGTEATTTSAGPAAVRLLEHTTVDRSGYTYSQAAEDAQTTEWTANTPLVGTCRGIAIDKQRNVYVVDGRAGVGKFNSAGVLVWKLVVAVTDQGHLIRALAVEPETGEVYLGVSEGGSQRSAAIFKYAVSDDGSSPPNLLWKVVTEEYCEKLVLRNGVLFAALNDVGRGTSEIVAYGDIGTAVPTILWRRDQVPYPTNDLDVRARDGAVVTAHPANSTRSYDPRSANTQRGAVDAEPPDFISDWATVAWCVLDAADVDGDETFNESYRTGDEVRLWRDKSGNNRSHYANADILTGVAANCLAPKIDRSGRFGGNDCLNFAASGTGYGTTWSELVSQVSGSVNPTNKLTQRGLIPLYTNASYTVIVVARATAEAQDRSILHQDTSSATGGVVSMHTNTTGGVVSAGALLWRDSTFATQAFDSTNGWIFAIVTFTDGTAATAMHVNGAIAAAAGAGSGTDTATFASQIGACRTNTTSSTSPAFGTAGPFDGQIAYIATIDRVLTQAEREAYEGYLAWRFKQAYLLPTAHPYYYGPPTVASRNSSYWGTSSPWTDLTRTEAMVVKWDPNSGRPRWVARDDATWVPATSTETGKAIGGLGYAVAWGTGNVDHVFSMGTSTNNTSVGGTSLWSAAHILQAQSVVRRLQDNTAFGGDSVEITRVNGDTWQARWGTSASFKVPSYTHPRMAVASAGANEPDPYTSPQYASEYLYVPYYTGSSGSYAAGDAVYIYQGIATAGSTSEAATSFNFPAYRTVSLSTSERAFAVAVPVNRPEYIPGQVSSLSDEIMAVAAEYVSAGAATSTVHQIRLVNKARANVATRYGFTLAGTSSGLMRCDGSFSPTSGGYPSIRATGWVMAAQLRNRFYITDGSEYWTVDPRVVAGGADGYTKAWTSKTSGKIPANCRLAAQWRNRIVLGRAAEDPNNWFMSAVDDPTNWDFFPVVPSSGQAVAGDTTFEGRILGVVNAIVPYNDDLLFIGCDQGILRITGDPARDEGRIDLVTDSIGMSFGEPWCRDPEGRLYFFGSRGGVYVATPSGGIESITDDSIRRTLQDVDLSTYYVRLVWNWRANGLHVFLCPYENLTGSSTAYFWERKSGGWFEDSLPFVVKSVRLTDGDTAASRAVLMGCTDGYVRRFSPTLDTDSGTPIYSHVVMGPFAPDDAETEYLFSRPAFTLASDLGGADVAVLASDAPDVPGDEQEWHSIGPGRNDRLPIRIRGAFVWVRLRNRDTERWAYENGQIDVQPAGMRRRLS